ncbi:hypothetical protein BDB01DRAFT_908989 [Pilobolus umbonatus]|nr:hypothetical protein BDB01DRAFT_908989 [Pilobolus umbonatus]
MEDPGLSNRNKKLPEPSASESTPVSRVTKESEKVSRDDYNKQMNDHYNHLQKHVTEVRRQASNKTLPPQLTDYQTIEADIILSTRWVDYLRDYIKFYLNSVAYDDIDRPLNPFSLNEMKHNWDRLHPMMAPVLSSMRHIATIYKWENKMLTLSLFYAYYVLWYYDLILPCSLLLMVALIASLRLGIYAQYNLDVLGDELESDDALKRWNRNIWLKTKIMFDNTMPSDTLFEGKTIVDWKDDVYEKYGPVVQLTMGDTVDYMERMKNLMTWKRPARTRFLLAAMSLAAISLVVLPYKLIAKSIFFYLGLDFFVLQLLRYKYPRYRRIFNPLNLFLWGVPNDAEYALEMVQLSNQYKKQQQQEVFSNTYRTQSLPAAPSSSDESTTTSRPEPSNEKTVKKRLKKVVDNKMSKSTKEANNDTAADFGCIYNGNVPGWIRILNGGFVFQASRMKGNQILVDCTWDDMIGIKKTKGLNVLIWHSPGIEVSLNEGKTLKFDNVLNRDECFNLMATSSHDQAAEWKKCN